MNRLLFALLLVFATLGATLPTADAQAGLRRHVAVGTYFGWIPWYGTWNPYGYSFWGYYNYLPRYAGYGALAYDAQTNAAGWSYGAGSRWAAERSAVGYCGTAGCRSVVWVQGGCAAISVSVGEEKVEALGWGMHPYKHGAIRRAQLACKRRSATPCKVRAWTCSY